MGGQPHSDQPQDGQTESREQGCHQAELQVVEETLRRKGLRWTAQRRQIVQAVFSTHDHFSADELVDRCNLQDATASRATVYRTLAMLEEAGFVEGFNPGDGVQRYEHVLGHEEHAHMVCIESGRIFEFVLPELDALLKREADRHGFEIDSHSLKVLGVYRGDAQRKT